MMPKSSPPLSPPTDPNNYEGLSPTSGSTSTSTPLVPRRVDHTYRDYSRYRIDLLRPTDPEYAAFHGGNRKGDSNFPAKLHNILSTPEYSHIICWMAHGRSWKILNKDLLVQDVIPKYFGQSKYESFTRQLSGWGFKRLHQSGPDFRAYYHECFLRGLPRLTNLMKRVTSSHQGKLLPHPDGEPNFYEMETKYPLPSSPRVLPGSAAIHGSSYQNYPFHYPGQYGNPYVPYGAASQPPLHYYNTSPPTDSFGARMAPPPNFYVPHPPGYHPSPQHYASPNHHHQASAVTSPPQYEHPPVYHRPAGAAPPLAYHPLSSYPQH